MARKSLLQGGPLFRGQAITGWQRDVAALACGNPLLMFAIEAPLAGPLLDLFGLDGGGFGIHGGTSCGKITVLFAAMSAFRRPTT